MATARLDASGLSSFLALGFRLTGEPAIALDFSGVDPERFRGASEPELLALGAERLRAAVARGCDAGREHLLPISGGLDSRSILAVLLEGVEASRIHTCTFGTPGTWDYELGHRIARRLGTRHVSWPLDAHRYLRDELLETSRRTRHQTVLFHHPPLCAMQQRFGGHLVWSGFLGDKLTRAPETVVDEDEARRRFLKKNRYVRSTRLHSDEGEARLVRALVLPPERRTPLGAEEDLGFEFRQRRFIAPHVLPLGFEYRTPYADPELMGFFLSLPRSQRANARFFHRLLPASFPALFSIGAKITEGLPLGAHPWRVNARKLRRKLGARLGRPAWLGPDPMLNYLDFDRALRERADLRGIVGECVERLAARGLLAVDPVALWRRHLQRAGDHADALIVLTSLELHLEAGLEIAAEELPCSF